MENTPESYRTAIQHLMNNDAEREALGRRAYAHARAHWDPKITEAAYVEIYKELLEKKNA